MRGEQHVRHHLYPSPSTWGRTCHATNQSSHGCKRRRFSTSLRSTCSPRSHPAASPAPAQACLPRQYRSGVHAASCTTLSVGTPPFAAHPEQQEAVNASRIAGHAHIAIPLQCVCTGRSVPSVGALVDQYPPARAVRSAWFHLHGPCPSGPLPLPATNNQSNMNPADTIRGIAAGHHRHTPQ